MATEEFGGPETSSTGSRWSTGEGDLMTAGAARTNGQNGDNGVHGHNGHNAAESSPEQARDVAQAGVEAGKHVAAVSSDQAQEVISEFGHQAKLLLEQVRSELMDAAANQQRRVAEGLHALSQELGSMASKSQKEGLGKDLASQASRQVGSAAHWISEREPGSVVSEVRSFARSKPGMFVAIAAGVGLVAGRMTRGVKAGAPGDAPAHAMPVANDTPVTPYPAGDPVTSPYPSAGGLSADDPGLEVPSLPRQTEIRP